MEATKHTPTVAQKELQKMAARVPTARHRENTVMLRIILSSVELGQVHLR
jgi:hypothetical protein